MGCRKALGVLVVALAIPMGVRGQTGVGAEFQVNTETEYDQDDPSLCHDAAGNFVVVWESYVSDGSEQDCVFAQRYDSTGMPVGSEFQANTYTTGDQNDPAVCCDDAGNFVVAWEGGGDQDGDNDGVFGRRFDSAGQAIGTEFQVNTYTTDNQRNPDVCCGAAGTFVVAWEGDEQDGDSCGAFARRYDSAGMPIGTEFQANTYTNNDQDNPTICCSDAADFVVAWASSASQDGYGDGVFGQRYASSGTAQGAEFQVNTYTTDSQSNPDLCCAANGNFVVVWTSYFQDGDYAGAFGQRFASGGAPQGTEFQVNTYTTYYQDDAEVCCDGVGNFVVAWESDYQDGDYAGVFGRRYSSSGAPQSEEFQVNTYTPGPQEDPDVSCDAAGNFVVAWASEGPDGTDSRDGDDRGVFAQRFASAVLTLQTPALSWLGLGALALALIATAARALRRRW